MHLNPFDSGNGAGFKMPREAAAGEPRGCGPGGAAASSPADGERLVWLERGDRWSEWRRMPASLFDRSVRRVLLMAGIAYWAAGEVDGTLSLHIGGDAVGFRVRYTPAPARLLLTRLPGERAAQRGSRSTHSP